MNVLWLFYVHIIYYLQNILHTVSHFLPLKQHAADAVCKSYTWDICLHGMFGSAVSEYINLILIMKFHLYLCEIEFI